MKRVYVTGGNGFLGTGVVAALSADPAVELVVSGDVREPRHPLTGVVYETADVTDGVTIAEQFRKHSIDTVVHLASIVNPGKNTTREQEYRIDVDGSRNVIDASVAAGVRRIVVSSSGAAYGYHADNPEWIVETDALRGNDAFAYARHKRLVEELLAETRVARPALEQVVFRIGTILGERVDNQITALFDKPRLLAVRGSDSPFVFIWDEDVVAAMVRAVSGDTVGIFNVAGDGALTVRELAGILGKRVRVVPAWMLKAALVVGRAVGATVHGPAQVDFLRYRPVLSNERLKREFGYVPRYSSREAFEAYLASRR